jgi:hypothetical protein
MQGRRTFGATLKNRRKNLQTMIPIWMPITMMSVSNKVLVIIVRLLQLAVKDSCKFTNHVLRRKVRISFHVLKMGHVFHVTKKGEIMFLCFKRK